MKMTTIPDASALTAWRKSSYSDNGGGGCVEVSDGYHSGVPVRDSKAPHGPALVFRAAGWAAFVGAVRVGDLS
ncbi:DUF397 domain-containing protein [Streptomyces sp. NPDC095613]|uniref:DUF397 domain-containing protein n=1 Tax=Streptomyces sp. NPDC095613 TaxID=3155540 RepID=UPI003323BAFC